MKAGLYVHVPFCQAKCGYCDFFSVPLEKFDTLQLTEALVSELNLRQHTVSPSIQTTFVGGGTPTVLPLNDLKLLFGALGETARKNAVVEFTTEANPATLDAERTALLVETGVNRISLGAQSFNHDELNTLQRRHDPEDIKSSIEQIRSHGVSNINLDLIFGIPNQSLSSWRESLLRAIDLDVDHMSCYGLTYESDTPLSRQRQQGLIEACDNELEADMYLMCIDLLEENGFSQYEISNFAQPGCECLHNLIYWNNWPYLGIGPSASSYLSGTRFSNTSDMVSYKEDICNGRPAWREKEKLTGLNLAGETAMMQLRMNRGINITQFQAQVGLNPLEVFIPALSPHVDHGDVEIESDSIRLTRSGRLIADRIIRDLLPANSSEN